MNQGYCAGRAKIQIVGYRMNNPGGNHADLGEKVVQDEVIRDIREDEVLQKFRCYMHVSDIGR